MPRECGKLLLGGIVLLGGRFQEAASLLVCLKQRFNLTAQGLITGALLGDKPGASRADCQLEGLRKYSFCLGCHTFHDECRLPL